MAMSARDQRDRAAKLAKALGVDAEEVLDLAKLDFDVPSRDKAYRLVMSSEGEEKCGKTHLPVFTMPEPVGFVDFDTGTEGLMENALDAGRVIIHKQFTLRARASLDGAKLSIEDYKREWMEVRRTIHTLVKADVIKSLVVDTGGEMWELCRLAAFGKLTQVLPHHYGDPKADYDRLIRAPLVRKDLNALYTHKVKAQYINDKRTGKKERSGFADMPFAVQCNILHGKTKEGEFTIKIKDCRKNHEIDGMELEGDMCDFPTIAMLVYPDSEPSDWGL